MLDALWRKRLVLRRPASPVEPPIPGTDVPVHSPLGHDMLDPARQGGDGRHLLCPLPDNFPTNEHPGTPGDSFLLVSNEFIAEPFGGLRAEA
jgi:hypothetical protein